MALPVRVRFAVAAALGLGAAAAEWSFVGPLPPFLDLRAAPTDDRDVWELRVTARGGESIEEILVEPAEGPLRVAGPASAKDLESGATLAFRLELDASRGSKLCGVRVSQSGRVSRTYELAVGGGP